jgi:hypothetical protein
MMTRLRGVDGVTRVSLQSSKKPAATDSVVDAAPGAQPVGCDKTGGATPPDFTVVAFFEQDAAASADASAGAAAGSAGATTASSTPASAGSTTASTTTDGAK